MIASKVAERLASHLIFNDVGHDENLVPTSNCIRDCKWNDIILKNIEKLVGTGEEYGTVLFCAYLKDHWNKHPIAIVTPKDN